MRRILAFVFACCCAAPLLAQSLPQVQPGDGENGLRDMSGANEARQWRAVGRLDTGVSFCSATLIAPDLVLTAAHCVFHPETHEALMPEDFTFLAGLRNGRAEAIRQVRRAMVPADYVHERGPELDMIGRDLALLQLRQPISPTTITPISAAEGRARDGRVTVVSYGRDRENRASIEEGCEILARRGPVRSLNCSVVQGASGSPVLRVNQGRAEVIAVMSASGHVDGEDISLAVMLDGQMSDLLSQARLAGPAATFSTSGGTTSFISPSNGTRGDMGARFVRP
ncbi:trypsin-like serine peptidase [Gymnodinialimonas ulvae]|uniref:trypsin-like serine peptidase n=1 Tax=Gymnodinialimonas ulvae TaxID=3126504 RepID=UPI0030A0C736